MKGKKGTIMDNKYTPLVFLIIVLGFSAVVIAVRNMPSGFALQSQEIKKDSSNLDVNAVQGNTDGIQVVKIGLKGGNYYPKVINLAYGKPVTIQNDGTLAGCAMYVSQPQLRINANFEKNKEYTFTPTTKGTFVYTCSMGMYKGTMNVL